MSYKFVKKLSCECIYSLSVALYLLPDSAGRFSSVCPAGLSLVAGAGLKSFRVSLMTQSG